MLKNVKDQLIDPAKDDPGRFINMQALLLLDHTTLSPHYERLAFLLESGDLVDLMVENETVSRRRARSQRTISTAC